MAQRYIYLSDELNNRLKQEANASGLIQQLLREHFKFEDNKTISPEERKKRMAILKIEIEAAKKAEEIMNGQPA